MYFGQMISPSGVLYRGRLYSKNKDFALKTKFRSVTSPLVYPGKRTTTRISTMIAVAWLVSLVICLPPLFGWRPNRKPGECTVSSELGYVIYSACGSFFIPVIVLVIVYWR